MGSNFQGIGKRRLKFTYLVSCMIGVHLELLDSARFGGFLENIVSACICGRCIVSA